MDCVCGCGRDVSKQLARRNFIAATVALELLAWDKDRVYSGSGPEGREGLVARGADCYQRLLYSLHGEGGGDPDEACEQWVKESTAMRARRPGMNKRRLLGIGTPNLSEAEMEQLDRRHPELSFTGRTEAASATRRDDDLVGKLERLRALRDDGILDDDEFAAAKARLLGRG